MGAVAEKQQRTVGSHVVPVYQQYSIFFQSFPILAKNIFVRAFCVAGAFIATQNGRGR
jgi:hypothetical protein